MDWHGPFTRWFVIGAAVAAILVFASARSSGGAAGLLRVGDENILRPLIEAELGDIPLSSGNGHDGQTFYAVGIDLDGSVISELDPAWAYRYRRILYPAVASGFGILGGYALLYSMITINVLAMGLAAACVAGVSARHGKSEWLALTVILNPGVWLSVTLLTADVFAIALMALALMLWAFGRFRSATAGFALSVLAKETYLVTPGGLVVNKAHRRWSAFLIPLGVLVIWLGVVELLVGNAFVTSDTITIPLRGMIEAARVWPDHVAIDVVYSLFSVAFVLAALVMAVLRKSWLRWSLAGWGLLGVVSSYLVWRDGNNSVRVFAVIPVLIALAFSEPSPASHPKTEASASPPPAP